MNKLFSVLIITLLSPFVMAWDYEECEAVNWNHKDCDWGPGAEDPQETSSNHRASNTDMSTVSLWIVTSLEYNVWNGKEWLVCARAYELKTFPGTGEYRETGVKVKHCLPERVYTKYPGIMGVVEK